MIENKYLEQVVAQQANVQRDLMKKSAPRKQRMRASSTSLAAPEEAFAAVVDHHDATAPAVEVRVTGLWRFKTVIVPPNAHVVHTRRGRDKPLTIGLGKSFRFNPVKDAYLVAPATTQTIMISANCICKELQGILVQGYVQWIIDDFETAYQRLDFSDPMDPMRIVNTQLREQAEAAIKDTVSTMSINDVLSDKQPIIKELTRRLREVTEGDGQHEGLGLGIVTVQIKEAVVSSARLWENLQKPFRAEREKDARLAALENEGIVQERETRAHREATRLEIDTESQASEQRAAAAAELFDREQNEKLRRAKLEAEALEQALKHERSKIERQAELHEVGLQKRLAAAEIESAAQQKLAEREIGLDAKRQAVVNDLSDEHLRLRLIQALPEILERMPKPDEQRNVSINGDDSMATTVAGIMQIIDKVRTTAKDA